MGIFVCINVDVSQKIEIPPQAKKNVVGVSLSMPAFFVFNN